MNKGEEYVDYTQELACVEWFHGYGGNYLGLKRVIPNLRSIAVCERDAFVVANMVSKMEAGLMDPVPIWTDCKTFPARVFKDKVGLFIASYPCQGFSHAGKRLGQDDPRHLWPDCRRFIQRARPGLVWLENVEGHVSLGLSTVLADLEADGYTAAWGIFSASEVGAPHQRKRVFILAYDDNNGCFRDVAGATPEPDSNRPDDGISSPDGELAHDMRGPKPELPRCGELGGGSAPESRSGIWPGTGSGDSRGGHAERDKGETAGVLPEDVAVVVAGLEGHAGDVNSEGREPRGAGGPVAEGGLSIGEGSMDDAAGLRSGESADGGPEPSGPNTSSQAWPSRPGCSQYGWEPPRVVGDTKDDNRRSGERGSEAGVGEDGERRRGSSGADGCEVESALGRVPYGTPPGLDLPGCTGLSDPELAEIREWMVKGTNRTDELRMCGNGVVPDTAERAFRVLSAELFGN